MPWTEHVWVEYLQLTASELRRMHKAQEPSTASSSEHSGIVVAFVEYPIFHIFFGILIVCQLFESTLDAF